MEKVKRPSRNPKGVPEKVIDWKTAEGLAKIQCTESEICNILDVDDKTLVKHIRKKYGLSFSEWYKKYADGGRASLRRRLFQQAHDDKNKSNVTAAIWLSKNYLGMKDSVKLEGGEVPFKFAYSLMDDELNKQDE